MRGGGICSMAEVVEWEEAELAINNSTIAFNSAKWGGGVANSDGTVNVKNTIVAGNTVHAGGAGPNCDSSGTITTSYNLESGSDCGFTGTGDLQGADADLGSLQDNGGPTWTHALSADSPAINAGSCTDIAGNPVTIDQRGVLRISPCDIGAYEYVLWVYLPVVIGGATSTPEPQIHIYGRVSMEDGTGMADVGIYAGVTCMPGLAGSLVATTDQEGYYEGETDCPFGHDETMRVFAVLEGYTFVPELDCWRTYGYCPGRQTDFVAFPFPTPAAEY